MRQCKKCGELKNLTNFRENKPGYFRRTCNECMDQVAVRWQQENRDRLLKWRKNYYRKNQAKQIAAAKKWNEENADQFRLNTSSRYRKLRDEAIAAYGGPICACCGYGDGEPLFLAIDHVENNQREYAEKLGRPHVGAFLIKWLKENGYPEGFQILCHSCNQAKHANGGVCPHKIKKV